VYWPCGYTTHQSSRGRASNRRAEPAPRDARRNSEPTERRRPVRRTAPPPAATARQAVPTLDCRYRTHSTATPTGTAEPHGPGGRALSRCRSRHDYFFGKYNAQLTRRTSLSVTRHDGSSLAGAGPAPPARGPAARPRGAARPCGRAPPPPDRHEGPLASTHPASTARHSVPAVPGQGGEGRPQHATIYRPDSSPFRLLGTTRRHLRPSPPLPPPRRWHRLQHRPEPGRC
jgi:hypothetical protein